MSPETLVTVDPSSRPVIRYPFTAVVGQERLKLALILSAVSPGIGGVLIRGEKGTAKSTIVRGLGPLIGEGRADQAARVVELPIGATEDRVIGSLDLTRVLRDGQAEFTPGLLARSDGGVLYIDEVNLLADHLVDVLLDAAASGRVTIERDGVSHTQSADFVLVGTMNPEEGELRPQLLDRFGLAVDVSAGRDVDERVEIVRRRMAFDADPTAFAATYSDAEGELAQRIAQARRLVDDVELPIAQLRRIAGICAHLQVDGLRGDIVVARTAAAHAALRGASGVDTDDVRVAVELALPHRRRRNPFDKSGLDDQELADALAAGDEAAGPDEPPEPPDGDGPDGSAPTTDRPEGGGPDGSAANTAESSTRTDDSGVGDSTVDGWVPGEPNSEASGPTTPGPRPGGVFGAPADSTTAPRVRRLTVAGIGDGEPGRRSAARSRRGYTITTTEFDAGTPVHLFGTVLNAAGRGIGEDGRVRVRREDLRGGHRIGQESNLVVFVVDLSGSMTARRRLAAVSGLCVDLLRDSYTRRDRVAVIVARGARAELVVPPTKSVDIAVRRLSSVRTGGRTPLAEGLLAADELIARGRRIEPQRRPLLVVLTDGRATAGPDAAARARAAAASIGRQGTAGVVVDCEQGMVRLGLAADLAAHLRADLIPMDDLGVAALGRWVRPHIASAARDAPPAA
ncbi:VWA domain-containing protein [Gordonia oryzae]|uniref:VWA domain-containing protein n=1 Tax=Gordonia oryzae TaxID=2487349 RepID=A0A3N4GQ24_9ACTN|nr:VWA domain-containing protein [Gordonia oryzae]RPA63577.1 VWA domain-containing protein [Gordonia oryzae]